MRPFAILLVLVAACGGGDDGTTGDQDAQQFCVSETNRYREMNGKADLTEAANLEDYADTGAMTDYDASTAHSHFSATQGGGIAFAENECPGFSGWHIAPGGDMNALVGMCIAAFYAEGPGTDYSTHGHYINMMGDYATLGCGIYTADNGDVTITQDYGN